jgi:hypothetical protein
LGITCGDASKIVTYVEAWGSWASGPDNECLMLWRLPLYWWGRIGLLVAFTGSLLLVAELGNRKKVEDLADWFSNMSSTLKRAAREYGGDFYTISATTFFRCTCHYVCFVSGASGERNPAGAGGMYVAFAQMYCVSRKSTAGVSVAIYCDLWRRDRIRTLVPFHHRVRHSPIHSCTPP